MYICGSYFHPYLFILSVANLNFTLPIFANHLFCVFGMLDIDSCLPMSGGMEYEVAERRPCWPGCQDNRMCWWGRCHGDGPHMSLRNGHLTDQHSLEVDMTLYYNGCTNTTQDYSTLLYQPTLYQLMSYINSPRPCTSLIVATKWQWQQSKTYIFHSCYLWQRTMKNPQISTLIAFFHTILNLFEILIWCCCHWTCAIRA